MENTLSGRKQEYAASKRSSLTHMIALAKHNLQQLLNDLAQKVFRVRIENEKEYTQPLARMATLLEQLKDTSPDANDFKYLSDSLEKFSRTIVEADKASTPGDSTRKIVETLSLIITTFIDKLEAKEIKVAFPQTQRITGEVTLANPPREVDMSSVLSELRMIEQAVKGIKLEGKEKHIAFPKEIKTSKEEAILKALGELKNSIDGLPKQLPKMEFPKTIDANVLSAPPQKYPMPVTNININPLRGFAKSRAITVTTALTPLPDEILSYRRGLIVFNNDSSNTLFIGGSDVTTTNGLPVPPKTYSPPIDAGPKLVVYGIASTSINVRVMEVSNENVGA